MIHQYMQRNATVLYPVLHGTVMYCTVLCCTVVKGTGLYSIYSTHIVSMHFRSLYQSSSCTALFPRVLFLFTKKLSCTLFLHVHCAHPHYSFKQIVRSYPKFLHAQSSYPTSPSSKYSYIIPTHSIPLSTQFPLTLFLQVSNSHAHYSFKYVVPTHTIPSITQISPTFFLQAHNLSHVQ